MSEHICPLWVGYLLVSRVRKLLQNPEKILSPYVSEGMTVLDIGCAMGFFSLPLGRMVGQSGKVICVDMQEKMVASLEKRARKAGVSDRIETRLCSQDSLSLNDFTEKIDFALAFAVVHEVPDASVFFSQVRETLKPGGTLLMAEPKGHVSEKAFETTISVAEQNGFKRGGSPWTATYSRVILLGKT
ncbi:MAG: methyltransferase type 11 [Deltaproteobacteria bacterium]|nr:MAG: methyltransferase type 11 [Deltaproteobacteria bacterium]